MKHGLSRALLPLLLLLSLAGCGAGTTYIVTFRDAKGLEKGAEVRYDNLLIGKVRKVNPAPANGGVEACLSIDRSLRRYVKSASSLIIRKDMEKGRPYVDVVVLDRDSPILPVGSRLIGAENEMELKLQQIKTNWGKNLLVVAAGVFVLLGLVYLLRFFLRFGALLIALVCSVCGANYMSGQVAEILSEYLPPDYRPDVVAFIVTALIIYFSVAVVFWILVSPFRKSV